MAVHNCICCRLTGLTFVVEYIPLKLTNSFNLKPFVSVHIRIKLPVNLTDEQREIMEDYARLEKNTPGTKIIIVTYLCFGGGAASNCEYISIKRKVTGILYIWYNISKLIHEKIQVKTITVNHFHF